MPGLFDVRKQLVFYGAYHNNPTNVRIHMTFVPLIVWSWEVIQTTFPHPSFLPQIEHKFNNFLIFELSYAAIYALVNWLYYFSLEPTAAILYLPQYTLMLLTATALGKQSPNAATIGFMLQGASWVAQFLGHGLAERRAPALFNNLLGALVLAPFFVHLEWLFMAGYKPQLHKDITNGIGVEITKIRKAEGDKRRADAIQGKED
ncbi:uncharacterized protein PHACADRAFT_157860 [Phanerochaete carnosa HHB-10118-sp]|uniref:DUF962-domain-containing protein n=1 Tax=Phanerochaete carnosa (strain HHB-10118-sp) TaxID=650164 RepID=K5W6C5_PHACS|nr:uncharacterized protein PHACADRAFT_157860 [Phanerochaete carnosa HHB-10118-sp]EKM59473.1 hypothetical protein PHACADRAFT_157860 [Phanerochaete carnosa HHB-10118-sp]